MAEEQTRKFDLPWGTLLPILAALAGVIAQFKPLVSTRPSVPSEKPIPVIAEQDVNARLWQDPIAVAQKERITLDAQPAVKAAADSHKISALADRIKNRVETFPEHVLVLAVMLDACPYIEQGESRLRARQAVLEGLNESGFVPVDGEHIGFVTIPGQKSPVWEAKLGEEPVEDGALLIPWEECRASDDA